MKVRGIRFIYNIFSIKYIWSFLSTCKCKNDTAWMWQKIVHQGARISMDEQLSNHQITVSRIVNMLGSSESATDYLSKCFYSVGMGDNDYINNYFQPDYYPSSLLYTPEQFAEVLIHQFSLQIEVSDAAATSFFVSLFLSELLPFLWLSLIIQFSRSPLIIF